MQSPPSIPALEFRLQDKEGGGSDPRAPPSFVQLRILSVRAILRHIPWRRGRGAVAAGEVAASPRGEGPEAPAPPRHAGLPLPPIVPRGWGGGGSGAEPGPAPPAAPQEAWPAAPADPGRSSAASTAPHPLPGDRRGSGGGGPAYRDVRDALLALVRHGPLPTSCALGPAGGLCGAGFRSVRLSLGPASRGRGDKGPGPETRGTELGCPWLLGPLARRRRSGCQHRPAPRGGRDEGGRRGLQTDSSSRRRGAEPDSPLSPRTRKLFPSDHPLPRTPPPAPQPTSPADPRPAHTPSAGPRPRSRDWVGLVFSGLF